MKLNSDCSDNTAFSAGMLKNSSTLLFKCNQDGRIIYLSSGWEKVLGRSIDDLMGHFFAEFQPSANAEADRSRFRAVIETKNAADEFETVFLGTEQEQVFLRMKICPLEDHIEGLAQNITELKQCQDLIRMTEQRFASLLSILQYSSENMQNFLDNALDHALQLTGSRIGYIYYYSEEEEKFILNSWSDSVMEQCSVTNPQTCYELSKTGIWGEAVRQRKPIVINDFEKKNPLKKGYPEGHVRLSRFLTVPIFHEDRIVAVIGVANKDSDYATSDILQLSLLMNSVWKVVNTRKAEEELKSAEEQFRFTFELSPVGTVMVKPDFTITNCNQAFCDFIGYSKKDLTGKNVRDITYKEDIDESLSSIRKILEGGSDCCRFPKRYIRSDGAVIWGEVSIQAKKKPDRTPEFLIAIIQDITERKKYEDLLREKELLFELFFEHSPIYMFFKDHEIRSLYLSRNFEKMIGRPIDQLLGKTMDDLFPSDLAKLMIEDDKRILREGKLVEVQEELNGRYYTTIKFPIIQPGKPTRLAGFTIDITESKIAEKALKKAAEDWQTTFDSTNDAMFLLDSDNSIVRANKTAVSMFDTSPSSIIGSHCWEVVHKTANHIPDCPVIKSQKSLKREIIELLNNDRWFQVTADPIIENGIYSGCVHIISDITLRKEAETEIKQNRDYIQAIFNSATEAIIIYDPSNGMIQDVNRRMSEIYGYTPEEAISLSVNELSRGTPPYSLNEAMALFGKAVSEGPQTVEWLSRNKKGDLFWTEISLSAASIGDKHQIIATARDISTRKKTEEVINRAQKMESLGVLAGGIAHDFNNLLSGIFGFLSLATMSSDLNEMKELVIKALNVKSRAQGLTLQLLTFSKGGAPVKSNGKLFPMVKETVEFALSGSNITSRFSIPGNLHSCNFDRNQISQVFDNLTINAKQAMPLGGTLFITAENADIEDGSRLLVEPGQFVKISIRDTGIGIPSEYLGKIFDPFFTTKQTGSGLGLATCYSILRQHGGAIEAESKPGKETVFHVWIPADSRTGDSENSIKAPSHRGTGKILLLDDDEVILDLASRMLRSLGYDADTTRTGEETFQKIMKAKESGLPYRAVILDLTVPGGMGGVKTAQEIRKFDSEIRLFVVSGYSDDPVMADPASYGFNGSMAKPFLLSDLTELLSTKL